MDERSRGHNGVTIVTMNFVIHKWTCHIAQWHSLQHIYYQHNCPSNHSFIRPTHFDNPLPFIISSIRYSVRRNKWISSHLFSLKTHLLTIGPRLRLNALPTLYQTSQWTTKTTPADHRFGVQSRKHPLILVWSFYLSPYR